VAVGSSPLFNGLVFIYGLPILWIWKIVDELQYFKYRNVETLRKSGYGLMLLLAFGVVSLNVRQIFHGTFIDNLKFSNAEIYSYSIAWLIFGIILLILGTYCKNKVLRMASLAFMILTIGKVFFFDARELEGLLRVASFLGLGFSLLSLSWFYTKFNFPDTKVKVAQAPSNIT
ncbi:MAG: DUF2339 domain-containing protein, partial [Parachlamydiaceae bacterium]|nr:DUF2339 domain-containing protein [Parachlamydiaceae bacterium]